MTKRLILVAAGITTVGITLWARHGGIDPNDATAAVLASTPALVAASGRVEPLGEERAIGAEVVARLVHVLADEGEAVEPGAVLAELDAAGPRAQLGAAEARLSAAQAGYQRLINGARVEERREADAERRLAAVAYQQADVEQRRRERLYTQGAIALEEAERASRDVGQARARLDAATARAQVVSSDARDDDRAMAEAEVALATSLVAEARARLDKTIIRSPIAGVVVRRYGLVGEVVSPDTGPLFVLADTSALRVRAEIDETEVAGISVGRRARVRADAYGDREFAGVVTRVAGILGRKRLFTERPTERVDTAVLETLIDLDPGARLPLGLRVDVFIEVDTDR